MATEFKLPDLGENIASGDVVTVFVSEGDVVKPGQALLEVETDKAVIEVPCPPGGLVAKVLVKKGDTVKVGQPLVMLDAATAAAGKPAAPSPKADEPKPSPALGAKPAAPAPVAPTPAPAPAPASAPAPAPAPWSLPGRPCVGSPVNSVSTSPASGVRAPRGVSSAKT